MGWQSPEPQRLEVEPVMQEMGVPVMEVFVRRDSAGRLHRQACVVKADPPAGPDSEAKAALDTLTTGALHPRSAGQIHQHAHLLTVEQSRLSGARTVQRHVHVHVES
jgi:hypothetical protein